MGASQWPHEPPDPTAETHPQSVWQRMTLVQKCLPQIDPHRLSFLPPSQQPRMSQEDSLKGFKVSLPHGVRQLLSHGSMTQASWPLQRPQLPPLQSATFASFVWTLFNSCTHRETGKLPKGKQSRSRGCPWTPPYGPCPLGSTLIVAPIFPLVEFRGRYRAVRSRVGRTSAVSGEHWLVTLPMRNNALSQLGRGPRTLMIDGTFERHRHATQVSLSGQDREPPCATHKELPSSGIQQSGHR